MSSIFSAEAKAILLALDSIQEHNYQKSIIFSDSQSCLQAIQNLKVENTNILCAVQKYHALSEDGKEVILCWIPSHVGIKGNELADAAAKAGLQLPITDSKIPHSDYKMYVHKYICNLWQNAWNGDVSNKLHYIKPVLGEWTPAYRDVRRDEVVLCRCRIGHTLYTDLYLLKGEPRPECVACQCPLTVRHILIDCVDFAHIRQRYFNQRSIQDLFREVEPNLIFKFLKEIHLFRKF